MDLPLSLTIEQEFQMKVFAEEAEKLTAEQARTLLIESVRQGMIKNNVVKHLMKKELGAPCC